MATKKFCDSCEKQIEFHCCFGFDKGSSDSRVELEFCSLCCGEIYGKVYAMMRAFLKKKEDDFRQLKTGKPKD